MKEIRITKLVEQTTVDYIAIDGKKFAVEKDCIDYERRLNKEKVLKDFSKIASKITIPCLSMFTCGDLWFATLKDDNDFETLLDYVLLLDGGYEEDYHREKKPTTYPCQRFVATVDGCWANIYANTTEEVLQDFEKGIADLKKCVKG